MSASVCHLIIRVHFYVLESHAKTVCFIGIRYRLTPIGHTLHIISQGTTFWSPFTCRTLNKRACSCVSRLICRSRPRSVPPFIRCRPWVGGVNLANDAKRERAAVKQREIFLRLRLQAFTCRATKASSRCHLRHGMGFATLDFESAFHPLSLELFQDLCCGMPQFR